MSAGRAWARAGVVLAVVLALDQLTKALVRRDVVVGERRDLVAFVDLVHVRNDGIAFGALAGGQAVVSIAVGVALLGLVAFFAAHARGRLVWLPTGLLLGGALGNVVDRLRDGAVTDFLKLPHWPAFNVADSAITIGVVSLFFVLDAGRGR